MVLLHCEQCGCSGGLGMGWASFVRGDPDDTDDGSWIGAYCPRCAVARFGYGRGTAEKHVCVWDPPPNGRDRPLATSSGGETLRAAVRRPGEVERTTLVTGIAGRG